MTESQLTQEIFEALAEAGDDPKTVARVAPEIARAVLTLPIQDFAIVRVHGAGRVSLEYTFGPAKHSIHKAKTAAITTDGIEGSLLSRGLLANFARATWSGAIEMPNIWFRDDDFRRRLAEPQTHLATIQEVIFVGGFWDKSIDYATVVCGYKMPGRKKDVDWRFRASIPRLSRWVNLEVKRRDGDIKALLAGGRQVVDPFADITAKFTPSDPDEINLAAITVFGSPVDQVAHAAGNWLARPDNQNVDCILVWNEFDADFRLVSLPSKEPKLLELVELFDPPTPQPRHTPMIITHPLPLEKLLKAEITPP